ncbi:putative T7SS-secreted protein [Streptomyces sp. NPDC001492]
MSGLGLPGLDGLGKATQGLRDGIADGVQYVTHGASEGLDAVGAHDLAKKADGAGSWVADHLGANTSELELDESDDPDQLLHGDASRIRETAVHLLKFSAAFERTGQSLRKMDAHDWRGEAADRFREKVSTHPKRWLKAADAFEKAASAMVSYAETVAWARGQAREAVAKYKAAQTRTDAAREHYNAQVDAYSNALWQQNSWTGTRGNTDQLPPKPGDFQDPGADERAAAEHLLKHARHQRDSDADTLAAALESAYSQAPPAPQGTDLLKREVSNTLKNTIVGTEHRLGGVVKAGTSVLRLARTVNPTDPYNISHPGQYVANLAAVGTGLVHSVNHPTELVKGFVGDGWSTDRNQALGALATNFIPVGGAAKVGASTAAHTAENSLAHAAENTLARDAAHTGTTAAADASKGMSANAAKTFEDFGGGLDNTLSGIEHNIDAAAPDAAQGVSHSEVPQLQHAAESATGDLDKIGAQIDELHVNHPDSPTAAAHEPTAPSQAASGHATPETGPVKWTAPPTGKTAPPPEAELAPPSGPYESANANKAFDDFAPKPSPAAEAAGHDLDAIGKKIDELHVNQPHDAPEYAHGSDTHESSGTVDADSGRGLGASSDVRHLTNDEAFEYGSKNWSEFVNKLPDEQYAALREYSTHKYDEINGWLRGQREKTPELESIAQHMDEALAKSHIPESLMVRRGTEIQHWLDQFDADNAKQLVGRTLSDKGYFSTSIGETPAFGHKPVWLHLEVPEGHPGIWMDQVDGARNMITANPKERELLLPQGTQFEVTHVTRESGKIHIHGKVLE